MKVSTKQKYSGSCHCNAVKFEFKCLSISEALQCNCSICSRKNGIMSKSYIIPEDFKLLTGQDSLSIYHWNDKDVNHYFCKVCGIYPFHDSIYEPGKYRVNLCCVEQLDVRNLSITLFDGRNEL